MVDRLADLKTDLINDDEVELDLEAQKPVKTKPKSKKEQKEQEEQEQFQADVENINQKIGSMKRNVKYTPRFSNAHFSLSPEHLRQLIRML